MPSRRKRKKKAQGSASKEAREGESRDYPPESNDNPRLRCVTEEDERSAESLRRSLWPVDADFVDATRHAQDNEVHGRDDPWWDGSAYGQRLDELEGQDRNPGRAENRSALEDRNDQYRDWWSLYVTKFKQLCSEVKLILARLWLALAPLIVSLCRFLRPHLVSLCCLLFRLCLDLCLFLLRGFAKLCRALWSWILKESLNVVDLLVTSIRKVWELIFSIVDGLARVLVRLFWFLVSLLCSAPTVFLFLLILKLNGKLRYYSAEEQNGIFLICCVTLSLSVSFSVLTMQQLFLLGVGSLVLSWRIITLWWIDANVLSLHILCQLNVRLCEKTCGRLTSLRKVPFSTFSKYNFTDVKLSPLISCADFLGEMRGWGSLTLNSRKEPVRLSNGVTVFLRLASGLLSYRSLWLAPGIHWSLPCFRLQCKVQGSINSSCYTRFCSCMYIVCFPRHMHMHTTHFISARYVAMVAGGLYIGLASDDVKLVLNNIIASLVTSIHMYTKTGKSFAELRLSFVIDGFFDRLFSELPWIRENFFLLPSLAECFILTTNLETGRESCFFQAPRSPDAASVACMRTRVNSLLVLRLVDCGSMFAGKWDHQSQRAEGRWNMSRQSKKQTVYSTCWESATFSPRRICLFSPLKNSVVIESNTNRNICSMENTKIKARLACKLLFTKMQAKEKNEVGRFVEAPVVHSLCVSHGYEPTPRLFRTKIALLCENDVALASLMWLIWSYWTYRKVEALHKDKIWGQLSFLIIMTS